MTSTATTSPTVTVAIDVPRELIDGGVVGREDIFEMVERLRGYGYPVLNLPAAKVIYRFEPTSDLAAMTDQHRHIAETVAGLTNPAAVAINVARGIHEGDKDAIDVANGAFRLVQLFDRDGIDGIDAAILAAVEASGLTAEDQTAAALDLLSLWGDLTTEMQAYGWSAPLEAATVTDGHAYETTGAVDSGRQPPLPQWQCLACGATQWSRDTPQADPDLGPCTKA